MASHSIQIVCVTFLVLFITQVFSSPTIIEKSEDLFPVSIIHMNDFHARFEETSLAATSCKEGEKCIGGYARAVTKIKELQQIRPNPIYLNAGDNFQGTLWYSLGRWNVTAQFLNMLNADAVTLGNHEFDHRVEGVVPFMETLKSPVIVANIDDSDEPTFQGKYQKHVIIDRYDRKIGVIGIILSTVDEISNTDNLRFYNEEETIRKEAELLKEQGVDIIIALTHCGLDVDYRIAKVAAPYVDVIVGGHSHTFMYDIGEGYEAPGPDIVKDTYPAVVETDGHTVLIVQASAFAKYIGDITVYFDKAGNVAKWEGAPAYLDTDVVPDPEVMEAIQPWKEIIDERGRLQVGITKVSLLKSPCIIGECNLGNFVADAMVHYFSSLLIGEKEVTKPIIGLVPYGTVRTTLNAGPISFMDLATTVPFENSIDTFEFPGKYLKDLFEQAVKTTWETNTKQLEIPFLIQVSGARVVYNMTNEPLNRVVSIEALTIRNNVPRYEPVDHSMYYNLICSSFLADGGDGFKMISEHKRNHRKTELDIDVVLKYLQHHKVIYTGLENRLTFV